MKLLDSGSAARKHEPAASDLLLCFTEAEARMAFTSVTSRMTTLISSLLYGSMSMFDVYFRIFSPAATQPFYISDRTAVFSAISIISWNPSQISSGERNSPLKI